MIQLRLSIMMFLQFFIWGSWYVSMTGWMSTVQLGGLGAWAYTVCPIAAIISPFFVGMIADRYFATQKVLGILHLMGGACLLAVPTIVERAAMPAATPEAATFTHPYVMILLAHALCYMPTLSLTNSLAFTHMSDPARQFPPVRTLGTIGWIVGNLVVGGITIGTTTLGIVANGDKSSIQWYVAGIGAILLGIFCFTLPNTPPPAAGKKISAREVLGLDSLRMFKKRSYLIFAICSFLLCIPLAGYYSNARNFVEYVNADNIMLKMSLGQMSEIVFMLLMPLFFRRLGFKWMLAVGMLAWALRYTLFAGAADDRIMWMTLAGIALHGICYDFFFVTGFIYVDKVAPAHIRGQAQGFLVLLTQGLGMGIGAILFGKLVGNYTTTTAEGPVLDWEMIWAVPVVFALVVLGIFLIGFKEDKSLSKPST